MRTVRTAWVVLVSMLVLVAAGCGSEDVGMGGPSAAELVKPGALVYWEAESDPESDQWKQVEELIRRFPDGDKWIVRLRESFEKDSELSWAETKEALSGNGAVVVYAKSMSDVQVLGLLHPDDVDETMAFIEKANRQEEDPDDRLIARKVDDWVALADKESSFDALTGEGDESLAGVQAFQDGMAELPEDALSRVYVDVAAALETFGSAEPESARALRMLGLNQLDFAGAWAKALDDGAELAGVLRGEGADKLLGTAEEYTSSLLDRVPADALAVATFKGAGIGKQVESLRDNPLYAPALREFENESGVTIADVLKLFEGEVAFYLAPGAPIPEVTLLLDPDDPAQARESAERLLRSIAAMAVGEVTEAGDVTTAVFDGVTVNLAVVEDTVVITTTKDAIARLEGEKLTDTDRYKDALEAAGAPDQYTGLVWIDLKETIALAMGFASVSGESIPPEVSRNLEPLRSVVAYGEKDGDLAKSLVFVGIE